MPADAPPPGSADTPFCAAAGTSLSDSRTAGRRRARSPGVRRRGRGRPAALRMLLGGGTAPGARRRPPSGSPRTTSARTRSWPRSMRRACAEPGCPSRCSPASPPGRWWNPPSSRASWTSSSTTSGRRSRSRRTAVAPASRRSDLHTLLSRQLTAAGRQRAGPCAGRGPERLRRHHRLRGRPRSRPAVPAGGIRRPADLRRARRVPGAAVVPARTPQHVRREFRQVRSMPSRAATVEALVAGQIESGCSRRPMPGSALAPVALLADDRGLQPHENVVPLVRTRRSAGGGRGLQTALGCDQRTPDHGGTGPAEPGRGGGRPHPGRARPPTGGPGLTTMPVLRRQRCALVLRRSRCCR